MTTCDSSGSDLTIGQAAQALSVTARTLRHWDDIGLLQPTWRSSDNHRVYTPEEMTRARQILVFRAAGVPLRDIGDVLDHPRRQAEILRRHRRRLEEDAVRLRARLRAVDTLLKGYTMTTTPHDDNQDPGECSTPGDALWEDTWDAYREEAAARWGDTDAWQQAQSGPAGADLLATHRAFVDELLAARAAGVAPGSPEAARLVHAHRDAVGASFECTAARQVLLARMYVDDERFARFYQGAAGYLRDLVEAQAASEGVDLQDVAWG
ncbi:MerR family transcriptional regulator [Corynebacterium sp. 13CS0277]|uniref:MerR family transcriptional regulator n=1 Tax=Corynebacterium sp. 13CS0277 TaxID=2071994 RepID=UPI000D039765|nr:MerR family transcriptional regulator [Corynebacterium sp. 13CS0277]PRQ12584.1 MerR family transcriptional regulator [Corynebacterium sp. 13CS0277]